MKFQCFPGLESLERCTRIFQVDLMKMLKAYFRISDMNSAIFASTDVHAHTHTHI